MSQNEMISKIEQLRESFAAELAAALSLSDLEALRVNFLGKKGHIAELMKGLRDVEDKKAAGQLINTFKNEDIAVLRSGKAKKNDPPIPEDLAPISGAGKRERFDEPSAFLTPIKYFDVTEEVPAPAPAPEAQPAAETEEIQID